MPFANDVTLQTVPHATILRCMENVARRYRLVIAELHARRVPLICRESANGRYVQIITGTGISVATLSRDIAIEAGIIRRALSEIDAGRQRYTEEKHMPSALKPVHWQPTHAADIDLRPLLDANGRVDHVFVRLAAGRYPPQRTHYRLATYTVVSGTSCFLDPATARLIDGRVTGWVRAE